MFNNEDNDMRKYMDLFEEDLNEAGFLSRTGNKIKAGLGNKTAQGMVDRDTLSKQLIDNFSRWSGRTGQKSNLQSVQLFLQKVGFQNEEINGFTSDVVKFVSKNINNEDGELTPEDVVINPKELDNIMDKASEYAYLHNFNIQGKGNNTSQTNSKQTRQDKNNSTQQQPEEPQQSNSGKINFSNREIKKMQSNGVSERDVFNLIGDSKEINFNQMDNESKEKLAAIAYSLFRYTKGTNL